MENCPKCKVALVSRKVKTYLLEPGKKPGAPFYATETECPKCKKDKNELLRIKAEMVRKKALRPRKCLKCKIMMIRSQEMHQLWRKVAFGHSLLEPEEVRSELIATTSVQNPTWRCPQCGHKIRTKWGHNFVTMSVDMKCVEIFFPDDWDWNTEDREVWVDL
jgi:hypothetical protein